MKLTMKKIFIASQMAGIILIVFLTLYIPALYLNVLFLNKTITDEHFIESIIIFVIMGFGTLFVCLAIAGKVFYFYNDLFEFEKKMNENPEVN